MAQFLFRTTVADGYVAVALVAYEHLLTFDQALKVIWRRKWSGATLLFFLNRYLLLLTVIFTALPDTPTSVS